MLQSILKLIESSTPHLRRFKEYKQSSFKNCSPSDSWVKSCFLPFKFAKSVAADNDLTKSQASWIWKFFNIY